MPHGDPVAAEVRRYLHLRHHEAPPNTAMCSDDVAPGAAQKLVTGSNRVFHLRANARKIGFQRLRFHAHEIVSHSLRSGGTGGIHQVSTHQVNRHQVL